MLKSNLRLGPNGPEITSTLNSIGGTRSLDGYRLAMQFDWLPNRWPEWSDARVMVGGELEVSFGGSRYPVGHLEPRYGVAFADGKGHTYPASVELTVCLSDAALERLEQLRSGGEIQLHLALHGVRTQPADSSPKPETFWGELEYRLSPGEWAEFLGELGYAETFLLQVPALAGDRSARALEAARELESAVADMTQGRHRDAIAKCRATLERAWAEDANLYPELEYKVAGHKQLSKEQRFWLIRRGAWSVAHAANHNDETTAAIEWERRDAESLIRIVSAMLEQDPPL